ncbi:DUF4132 domain-containing protein [Chryseobacterium arthrosphaerae]|uniref:DUF4132 domain-containing protein n=1 Tax=Chryseobacterium arthrosphaerae TaxID=651561 RepID=UPI0023E32D12|nr:DUF4132 domain-containing protein [Chryseobacterium arthrosphaerae]WES95906.1 DUF4132 domain-containing protein [Chryseobacterium arthrosphaerae]
MEITKKLESKKLVKNYYEKLRKDLLEHSEQGTPSQLFPDRPVLKKEVAELGKLLKGKTNYFERVSLGSKEAEKLKEYIKPDIWEDQEYYNLLIYLFGDHADLVKYAWNKMPYKMYQTNYSRRSFRTPHHEEYVRLNQVNFIRELMIFPYVYSYNGDQNFDLTLEEQIIYDNEFIHNSSRFYLWSAAIDTGNTAIYQLIEDIIFNKHPEGKVSLNIIKALLNSEQKKCWELVEKLLLAAQRQEGLRQIILEALDETNIEALRYMINVIIEQKLTRFSSVVRSIDTWTGLGWEAEKESVVKNILSWADHYFKNPDEIPAVMKSRNNNEIYMALWVQGVWDVQKTVPYLHQLFDTGDVEKKCLAVKFAMETADPYIQMPLYYKAVLEGNIQVLAFAGYPMSALLGANTDSKHFINNPDYPDFFEKLHELTLKAEIREKKFEGKIFSWLNATFRKSDLYASMFYLVGEDSHKLDTVLSYFDQFDLSLRELLTRNILGEFYCYSLAYGLGKKNKKVTAFQKEFAFKILKDRGEALTASGINVLMQEPLSKEEVMAFFDLFKRKGGVLRKKLIELIVEQEDDAIIPLVDELMGKGDLEQRAASLDIMLQLQKNKRVPSQITGWTQQYSERTKISEREQGLLDQINPSGRQTVLSEENGFGFYDPDGRSPFALPEVDSQSLYAKSVKKNKYGFTQSVEHLKDELKKLNGIYLKHKDHEYEAESWDGSSETVLLGNNFRAIQYNMEGFTPEQITENYPLHEVWEQWFKDSGLQPQDLFLLTFTESCDRKKFREFLENYVFYYKDFIPNPLKNGYHWDNPVMRILETLQYKFSFQEKTDFLIDACSTLFANLPEEVISFKSKDNDYYYSYRGNGWQQLGFFNVFLEAIPYKGLTDEQYIKKWNLSRWAQLTGLKENINLTAPQFYLFCKAYELKVITKQELYEGILTADSAVRDLTRGKLINTNENLLEEFPILKTMIDEIRDKFLDIELIRGDANTAVSHFVQEFQTIYGTHRFAQILKGLGKSGLYANYIYTYGNENMTRQKLFSKLISDCYPLESDTQKDFNEIMKKEKISELRLIQAAVYAPQWQPFISNYLGWKGLDSAIWWMHAHTKTGAYEAQNAKLESEVAKYSSVDIQEFKDGAVDKDWFTKAYKELGKARWEMLYESAKYISDGNGHRRARLYSDTLSGSLKIKEVTAKVKDKRDQDYLRVYGLVPLSKANPEKDVLSRYEYIQQFKKESKEFGSMKQASEALAIRVALENLARNAGYPDPVRLTWAMETKQIQALLSKDTQVTIDGVTVGLIIEDNGKAELVVFRDDKQLKSIPPKIRKDKAIVELGNNRKIMREQWARSRKGLEEAMIRGDEFFLKEIKTLFEHPVIVKHLEKLVLISSDQTIGFYHDGALVNAHGEIQELNEDSTLRIAHCVDLHEHSVWSDYQHYCFKEKLVQPFRQIFRELYVPTPDELKEKSISRRYAGHQIQPKQTLALLKTRGWKVDYEEGLQKVYHKEGFQVKLYAMADWFSPADIESPTLETIEFHSLKDYKNIPFEDINPRIFSEVMRDVDLVVSVAHVGGVDPEASHSSVEMRAVLMKETARLFKLDNIRIEGSHVLVKGQLAEYSVHLGSAVVHQTPGRYLSILPVHSQHRGRLFLPFADDDPKSAEVLSKVLLLAKDNEIQDPTILSQIRREYV